MRHALLCAAARLVHGLRGPAARAGQPRLPCGCQPECAGGERGGAASARRRLVVAGAARSPDLPPALRLVTCTRQDSPGCAIGLGEFLERASAIVAGAAPSPPGGVGEWETGVVVPLDAGADRRRRPRPGPSRRRGRQRMAEGTGGRRPVLVLVPSSP